MKTMNIASLRVPQWIVSGKGSVDVYKSRRIANLFFFLVAAAKVCLLPFLSLFFRQLGLSATQTGLLCGGNALVVLVSTMMWRRCAFRFNKRRSFMVLSVFIMILTYLLLTVVPPTDKKASLMFCHSKNHSVSFGANSSSEILMKVDTTAKPDNISHDKILPTQKSLGKNYTTAVSVPITRTTNHPLPSDGSLRDKELENLHSTGKSSSAIYKTSYQKHPTQTVDGSSVGSDGVSRVSEKKSYATSRKQNTNSVPVHLSSHAKNSHEPYSTITKAKTSTGKSKYDNNMETLPIKRRIIGRYHSYVDKDTHHEDFLIREARSIPETLTTFTGKIKKNWKSLTKEVYALKYHTFFIVMAILFIGQLLTPPLEELADQAWHEYLDNVDDLEKYGMQRLWSSFACIIFAIIVVMIVDNTDCLLHFQIHHFMIHFYLFAVIIFLLIFIIFIYPLQIEAKLPKHLKRSGLCKTLCADCRSGVYIFTIIIAGFVYAPVNVFLFWFIQDKLGSEIQMGVALSVAAAAEFLMLMFGGIFIKRFGHAVAIVFGLLMLSARLLYYSFLWTPWAVVPIEILHAFSNTGLWMAVVSYPEFCANPRIERFTISVFQTLYHGVGFAAGSMIGGFVYDMFSLPIVFQAGACFTLFWTVLFAVFNHCLPVRQKVRYSKLLQDGGLSDSSEDDWLEMALKDH